MFVVSCCFRFPSKRMRLGCVLHGHGRAARVQTSACADGGADFYLFTDSLCLMFTGPILRRAFPRGAAFQPRCERLRGGQKRAHGVWLSTCLCGGERAAWAPAALPAGHVAIAGLCCRPTSSSKFAPGLSLVPVGCGRVTFPASLRGLVGAGFGNAGILLSSAEPGGPRLEWVPGQCSRRPRVCRCQCFLTAE